MVLQDIDPPSDSYDTTYSSDDASSKDASRHQFDSSTLAQPIPIVGPLFGFSEPYNRLKAEATIKYAEQKLRRPMTLAEQQALASHLYKLEQTKSYFVALGTGTGLYRWYTTMAQGRYPFYQPKPEDINPNKFLFFNGSSAQILRHSWRLTLYVWTAGLLGNLLGQVIAQPVAAQNTQRDPVLQQFAADLKATLPETPRPANPREISEQEHAQRRVEWQRRIAKEGAAKEAARKTEGVQTPSRTATYDDDMSPTAGNDPWTSAPEGSWGSSDFYGSDSQSQSQQQPAKQTSSWGRQSTRANDANDASPTGGLFQDEVRTQSKPGESAWDRLRRGEAPASAQRSASNRREPPHPEQREGSSLGDSFTFVDASDAERAREKERAQREFDARIERERQGKDFNDEKRW